MKQRDESGYPPHCQMMRQALKAKDWQQDVIAAIMGQSRSTVNTILTGQRRLTARDAIDYGAALQLSPDELLTQQNLWLLAVAPRNESALAAIRRRAATLTARLAADAPAEIASLQQERDAIDKRIAHLLAVIRTSKPAPMS